MPMPTSTFNTKCESFQMRYCLTFYLKGYQNNHNLKVKKFPFYLIKTDFWEVLTKNFDKSDSPFGGMSYSTSFKALKCGIEHPNWHVCASTFI